MVVVERGGRLQLQTGALPEPAPNEVRLRVQACGACGYCCQCRRGNAFACEHIHGATGVSRDGGYATHMLALASALARVPDGLDPVGSAPLLCAGVTTFNALQAAYERMLSGKARFRAVLKM